jgi:SAM-dependent methyltransferase
MSTTSNSSADYEAYWSGFQESAQYHPSNRFRYSLLVSRLKRFLKPGMSVLDMGCGDARLLLSLKSQWPLARFTGCDISHTVIGYNRERHRNIEFFQADVSAPGLADKAAEAAGPNRFDIVISTEVIEHVVDDGGLLRNAAALLAPGGIFILTTQSGPRYRIELEWLHHLRHYRRSDLEQLVRAAGLEIIESFNCGFPALNLQKIIANTMPEMVMRSTTTSKEAPPIVRAGMFITYLLMRCSLKWFGPQIVIVGRRPGDGA